MKRLLARERWPLLVFAAACVVLAYAFTKIGSEVLEGDLIDFDRAVRAFAQAHQTPAGNAFFGFISMLGTKPILLAVSLVVGWFLFRRVGWVVLILVCAIISTEFVHFLKGQFEVLRPPTALAIGKQLSFPSGHVSGTAAVATLLSYAAIRQRKAVWLIVPSTALIVILMGMSRIYLDMHWFSDVIGGVLIGTILGVGGCAVFEWMLRRHTLARSASMAAPIQPTVER